MQSTTRWCLNEGSMSSFTFRSEWVLHWRNAVALRQLVATHTEIQTHHPGLERSRRRVSLAFSHLTVTIHARLRS
jgi:pterin-4a-carbinolamine dehydratase